MINRFAVEVGMYNVKKGDGTLMLGCSLKTREEIEPWLKYYEERYPQYVFIIVDDAPAFTCDIPEGW